MEFLTRSIQRTADIAAGYRVGTLVIEDGKSYLQMENGQLIEANDTVEIRNGYTWEKLSQEDLLRKTTEAWPAFAGMEARMIDNEAVAFEIVKIFGKIPYNYIPYNVIQLVYNQAYNKFRSDRLALDVIFFMGWVYGIKAERKRRHKAKGNLHLALKRA